MEFGGGGIYKVLLRFCLLFGIFVEIGCVVSSLEVRISIFIFYLDFFFVKNKRKRENIGVWKCIRKFLILENKRGFYKNYGF